MRAFCFGLNLFGLNPVNLASIAVKNDLGFLASFAFAQSQGLARL